ncbi:MAG TPA: ATP phosphoribosyltransferase [Thermoanaerobaculia bacterium]
MRLALGKGRNLPVALAAFRAAGLELPGLDDPARRLRVEVPGLGLEALLLKDADVPLYVAYGVADLGVVGSDLLEESDGDLLVPARFRDGRSRLSLIGRAGAGPAPGSQVRLATKYPATARRLVARKPWGAEILTLSGSVEIAPLLDLAELALDVVQTGRTLRENGLVELEVVAEVAPCLVANRASFLRRREWINDLVSRLEAAGVVT